MNAISRNRSRNSNAQPFSGFYKCSMCKRMSRNTGEQAVGSTLCPECWDVAGLENQLDDGHYDGPKEKFKIEAEIDRLNQQAVNKGGVIDGYRLTKAPAAKPPVSPNPALTHAEYFAREPKPRKAPAAKPNPPLIQMEMYDALLAVTVAYGELLDSLARSGVGDGTKRSPIFAQAQNVLLRTKR